MPRLTPQQLQALGTGAYSRNGADVPGTTDTDAPLYRAACWAWALAGEFVAVDSDISANRIYDDVFAFDRQRRPTGTNGEYLGTVRAIWPDADAAVTALTDHFAAATGGDRTAQQRCRLALMTIAVVANGLSVNDEGADSAYFVQMNTREQNWYAWDHWALGIRMADGRTVNYVQTVTGIPLKYRCDRMWDESYFPTRLGVTELLPAHVTAIARIRG